MAIELPYLSSYKNVGTLFERIAAAKVPDAFTYKFLEESIGLKATTDRALIAFLKTLGFIDPSSKPTQSYATLKNPKAAKKAIAEAIRGAYKPLFDANERANELSSDELKGLVAQVAGTEAAMTSKIAGTFTTLAKLADFSKSTEAPPPKDKEQPLPHDREETQMRPDFHYNIQIHLPSNATEETYLNIFNAVRKVFK